MATKADAKVKNPRKLSDLNSVPKTEDVLSNQTPPLSVTGADELDRNTEMASVKIATVVDGEAITDIQKKMKRAERFGVTVQLTEEEKRNTRSERFGTATAVNGSGSAKSSEDLKRKARAERFGTVKSVSVDEETKKKSRLARFSSKSQADPQEEDKRKARAIRFSNASTSLVKDNGDESFCKKTVIIAGDSGAAT